MRTQLKVLDCRSLICLVKEVCRQGKEPVVEIHFFMSSLDPDKVSAKEFQDIILRHWEIAVLLASTSLTAAVCVCMGERKGCGIS